MELKITTEKVLEAAAKCSDAKNILKTLFPEAFNGPVKIEAKMNGIYINGQEAVTFGNTLTERHGQKHGSNLLHLESDFQWSIVKEDIGYSLVFKKHF